MQFAFDGREGHTWLEALLRDQLQDPDGLDCAIHADDEMLHYGVLEADGDRDAALVDYFVAGLQVSGIVRQLLAWRTRLGRGVEDVLDFGCGFGRVTRFLVGEHPPGRIWSADVGAEAVAFVEERLGVHGLVSSSSPRDFRCDRRFDLVFVASLFTHLPAETFAVWLERLLALLTEDGLIAFSVHDQALLPEGRTLPPSGLHFEAISESSALDPQSYGTTWVSETFVRGVLERSGDYECVRVPRGLCRFQDLYVAWRGDASPELPLELDSGPEAFLEHADLEAPPARGELGRLVLSGWAYDPSPGSWIDGVQVRLDDRLVGECTELALRADVAVPEGRDDLLRCGWQCRCEVQWPLSFSSSVLLVKAVSNRGVETILFVGSPDALLREVAAANWQDQRTRFAAARQLWSRREEELKNAIEAMRASRFWWLRDRWFGLKRQLGLTDQP